MIYYSSCSSGNGSGNGSGNAPGNGNGVNRPEPRVTHSSSGNAAGNEGTGNIPLSLLEEAITQMERQGRSWSWVIKNILGCEGRNFAKGKQALKDYLTRIGQKNSPSQQLQTTSKNEKIAQLKALITAGYNREQCIQALWGLNRETTLPDKWQDAEVMLSAMLGEIGQTY